MTIDQVWWRKRKSPTFLRSGFLDLWVVLPFRTTLHGKAGLLTPCPGHDARQRRATHHASRFFTPRAKINTMTKSFISFNPVLADLPSFKPGQYTSLPLLPMWFWC